MNREPTFYLVEKSITPEHATCEECRIMISGKMPGAKVTFFQCDMCMIIMCMQCAKQHKHLCVSEK